MIDNQDDGLEQVAYTYTMIVCTMYYVYIATRQHVASIDSVAPGGSVLRTKVPHQKLKYYAQVISAADLGGINFAWKPRLLIAISQ